MRVATIVAVACATRLVLLFVVEPSPGGDGGYYLHAAATGPDLYRPPLYSLFLAPFVDLGWTVYFAQSALTIGLSILCYRLTGSFLAALLIATCPFLIVYEYRVLSEVLLVTLLLSGWMLLDRGRPTWSGLCVGLAILTNDVFLLLPFFAIPFGIAMGRGRQFTIAAMAAYLTVLPWASYNLAIHDRFALSEGRAGFNLWVGTWERDADWLRHGIRTGNLPDYSFRSPAEKSKLLHALQTRDDATLKHVAVDRIASDPFGTISIWASRYWRLWLGTRTDQAELRLAIGSPAWTVFKSAAWGLNLVFLFGGIAGLVLSRKWVWAIPVLYIGLIYIPFHNSETRYSLPAYPFLLYGMAQWLSANQAMAGRAVHIINQGLHPFRQLRKRYGSRVE